MQLPQLRIGEPEVPFRGWWPTPPPEWITSGRSLLRGKPATRPQKLLLDRLLDLMLGAAAAARHTGPPVNGGGTGGKAGVSRAALARRFTALVGEPPMAYLADWRIILATDLLRETDHTVETIARHPVGGQDEAPPAR